MSDQSYINDLRISEQQIGWFHSGSKRFCYTDEKEHDLRDRLSQYTVPVFVGRVPTQQELVGMLPKSCQCVECQPHASDCAVHNEPAFPKGLCDCREVRIW